MKKGISLVLAVVLMMTLCAACGSDDGSVPVSSPTSASEETMLPTTTPEGEPSAAQPVESADVHHVSFPLADPLELTIALPLAPFANALMDDLMDWVTFREMEKITNVHWSGQLHPALNATETFTLMLSGGDWPDVMASLDKVTKNGNYQSYLDGIIIELTDLIAEYAPNVQAALDAYKELLLNLTYEAEDGSNLLLNFPMLNAVPSPNQESGLQYRGDWLAELGMDIPETISEFEAVMEAFHVNYDSWYYLGRQAEAFPITNALNIRINYDEISMEGAAFPLYVRDGQVLCGLLQDEFLEYLTLANKWYEAGYVDPDFFNGIADNIDAETARVLSGEFGMYLAGLSTYTTVNAGLESEGTNGYMVAGPSLLNDNHDETHLGMVRHTLRERCWTISSTCMYPEVVAAWIDYLFTDEGYILYNYGVEGETFNYIDGEPVLTDLILHNPDNLPVIMTEYVYTNNEASHIPGKLYLAKNLSGYSDADLAARDVWLDSIGSSDWVMPRGVTLNAEENEIYNSIFGDILTYFQESNLAFVTGERSLDTFDEYRDQLVELGMDTVVELYQQAYERYLARVENLE